MEHEHRWESGGICAFCRVSASAEIARLTEALATAREEIAIDDKLLADRDRILDALPCPQHGRCIPHAMEWIEASKRVVEAARALRDTKD